MKIGVPKEILNSENRVAITPSWVRTLTEAGHKVIIESGAGIGSSFTDLKYQNHGAEIVSSPEEIFAQSEIVCKVKQPLESEIKMLRDEQILFTYLHLASDPNLVKGLTAKGAHCIAYETIEDKFGRLPLLKPMSEIAGRMSVQVGARFLERSSNSDTPGRGILLGGASGVPQAKVAILGAGVVGSAALKMAVGMGAYAYVFDTNLENLSRIDDLYGSRVTTIYSNASAIEEVSEKADLIIGGVLIAGKEAPKLVTEDMVKNMKYGSVIVDVAVDQGGCVETSEVTTHENPIVVKHDVLHYGVANMPGAVPHTSTQALSNSTMPYLLKLANQGMDALNDDPGFKKGLNISEGKLLIDLH